MIVLLMEVRLTPVWLLPPQHLLTSRRSLLSIRLFFFRKIVEDFLFEAMVDDDLAGGAESLGEVKNLFEHFPHISVELVGGDGLLALFQKLFVEDTSLTAVIGVALVETKCFVEAADEAIDGAE
jgi:hypothetical protein